MHIKQAKLFTKSRLLWCVCLLIMGYIVLILSMPLPRPQVQLIAKPGELATDKQVPIAWPDIVQAAISLEKQGIVASYGNDKAVPTASIAKIITALAIMRQKPLATGDQGPTFTITAEDEAIYKSYAASGGSVAPVRAGQTMSQYQALQLLLLPSGNNMATTLSRWAFGSDKAYTTFANQMVKEMGLTKTYVADASGFSAQTVSTARELVQLGQKVMQHPVLSQIVEQRSATITGSGVVTNTNSVLGVAGINGIKTGTTLEAGGCLLFSATQQVGDQSVQIVGVVLGANNKEAALAAAPKLVEMSYTNVVQLAPLRAGQKVAIVQPAWTDAVEVNATGDLRYVTWREKNPLLQIEIEAKAQGRVGRAVLGDATTELVLAHALPDASFWWRFTHPITLLQAAFSDGK